MTQWPAHVSTALKQVGCENYTARVNAFLNSWGDLELETFARVLREGHGEDRVIAILAIGSQESAWARECLLPFLQSDHPLERWASAMCLGAMKEEHSLPHLLHMLTEFFPPKEWPTYTGDQLWLFNNWRDQTILLLTAWTQPEVVSALLHALQAYRQLEQMMPEQNSISRRYWRGCQQHVMYTLGWLGRFDVLDELVTRLGIVQPTLSSWRVALALGSLHAHQVYPDAFTRTLNVRPLLREHVALVLQERFGFSSEEIEHCLMYHQAQQRW